MLIFCIVYILWRLVVVLVASHTALVLDIFAGYCRSGASMGFFLTADPGLVVPFFFPQARSRVGVGGVRVIVLDPHARSSGIGFREFWISRVLLFVRSGEIGRISKGIGFAIAGFSPSPFLTL